MPTTSKNSNPVISCIYVNYRSAPFLEHSLSTLFAFEKNSNFEVIVVNNDQQESGHVEQLQETFSLKVQNAFQNPGFGASANIGAEFASGEILFFVNPDTRWQENFFLAVLQKFQEAPEIGAIGIQLVSPQGIPEKETGGKTLTFLGLCGFSGHSQRKEWLSGGALFIRRDIFQELGGFDEQFFMYFEDMDFCLRLQRRGYTILLDTEHHLIHLGGQSHVTRVSQKRIYDRSLYQYTKKNWNTIHHLIFRFFHPLYRFFFPYGRN